VLALNDEPMLALPYAQRRVILESITFGRGFSVRGIVAKKLTERYRPGERNWIKKEESGLAALPG